jgi:hypothetical protein
MLPRLAPKFKSSMKLEGMLLLLMLVIGVVVLVVPDKRESV